MVMAIMKNNTQCHNCVKEVNVYIVIYMQKKGISEKTLIKIFIYIYINLQIMKYHI